MMAARLHLSRRGVVAAIPVCLLAWREAVGAAPGALRSGSQPVLRVETGMSEVAAASLATALRRAPGCLRVDVFRSDRQDISMFQRWRTQSEGDAFWSDQAKAQGALSLRRLEI